MLQLRPKAVPKTTSTNRKSDVYTESQALYRVSGIQRCTVNKGQNPASGSLESSKGGIHFPGGTVVKNLPANAGDVGLNLDWKGPLE